MLFNDCFGYLVELVYTPEPEPQKCYKCDFNSNKPCPSQLCAHYDYESKTTKSGYLKIIREADKTVDKK